MATARRVKIGGAVLAGAVALGGAFVLGNASGDDAPKKPAAAATDSVASGLTEFRDDKAGWTISYPRDWLRLASTDADVALVVSERPAEENRGGSILARNVTLGAPVDGSKLAAAKEVTDRIVSGEGVEQVTEPRVLHQAGLPGYFYFYRFKDPASGQVGVHSHYFLFKGTTMISFVFQALPDGDFARLADLYDAVIASFRVL